MDYRREIDGLRALAVLPVILFHAGFQTFGGGFLGVDVFFVISGYLITSIILAEKQAGTFSLAGFYERRARRILPALFAVMCAAMPFAWHLMNPHQLKEFSQSLVAVAIFSSNILFWKQSDYFDADATLKPLLHTWSLGIEEQYYLLFPLLVILAWRCCRSKLSTVIAIIAVISFLLAETGSTQHPEAAFYLLPSRAWDLLIGSSLAFGFRRASELAASPALRQSISLIGLVSMLLPIFLINVKTPFPGVYALPTTLGAALVILFATRGTLASSLLSSRPLVWVGLISYSVYLWHQPILAFLKIFNRNGELSLLQYSIYFSLTFVLAYASHRFVETPFRRGLLNRGSLFFAAAAGSAFFICIGYAGHQTKGFLELKLAEVPAERRSILVDVTRERNLSEALVARHSGYLHQQRFEGPAPSRKVLFIGDSMAADLATAVVEDLDLFPRSQFRLLDLPNECLLYLTSRFEGSCVKAHDDIRSSALVKDADLVVVNFLWKGDADLSLIEEFLSSLRKSNRNLLVLGSAGFIDMATITYDLTKINRTLSQDELNRVAFDSRRSKFDQGNTLVRTLAHDLAIAYYDRKDLYCDPALRQCKMIVLGDGNLLWDNAHLSAYGMKITARRVAETGLLDGH